jgi:hypothetical protein
MSLSPRGFGIYAFLRNEPNFPRASLAFFFRVVPDPAQIFVQSRRKLATDRHITRIEQRGFHGDGVKLALALDQELARRTAVARGIEPGHRFACLGARCGARGGIGALGFNLFGTGHRISHVFRYIGLFLSYVNPLTLAGGEPV